MRLESTVKGPLVFVVVLITKCIFLIYNTYQDDFLSIHEESADFWDFTITYRKCGVCFTRQVSTMP